MLPILETSLAGFMNRNWNLVPTISFCNREFTKLATPDARRSLRQAIQGGHIAVGSIQHDEKVLSASTCTDARIANPIINNLGTLAGADPNNITMLATRP